MVSGAANIEVREPVLVAKHTKEHNRIMFNLKMALRLNNGIFFTFEVQKFVNRGVNFEEEHEKTTIECWYKPRNHQEATQIIEAQGLYIPAGAFEEFLSGSIVKTDDEIPLNTLTTYFIFKVVIGRAYVRRRSKMDPLNRGDRM